jgi:hypothetical protein
MLAPMNKTSARRDVRALALWVGILWASHACMAQASIEPLAADSGVIYVARRGWHIDIGMAAADLPPPLNAVADDLPQARYVFFGFGDRHYLMANTHGAPVLLSALWPGAGIVLVTGLGQSPQAGFGSEHVIELSLTREQSAALRGFIWNSLRTDNGALHIYREGPYEDSLYFLATPNYSALHTCNTWGAQALRASGLRVHSAGVIFAAQLWSQVRRLKREQAKRSR